MKEIRKRAIVNAVATAAYVVAVASFMFYGSQVKLGRVNSIFAPIALLMLFVFSASLTGFLIFGKPAQLYIDGKKKEALNMLTYTLGAFFVITLVAVGLVVLLTR